jgi:FkbM family methyltransferase
MSKYYWNRLKCWIKRQRRRVFELFGFDRYSRPALYEIDRKLEKYLPYKGGFFVEAGANDGFTQSNTYYFEKLKRWSGVLVEPIPRLYERCVRERVNSVVFNCALVPHDYSGEYVFMLNANLMSLVRGTKKSRSEDLEYADLGVKLQPGIEPVHEIKVPARTLTSVLDEVQAQGIDLLSLDVEGYELRVLDGLDLEKYRPKYMLIEVWERAEVDQYLSLRGYEAIDVLSYHDVLYKRSACD